MSLTCLPFLDSLLYLLFTVEMVIHSCQFFIPAKEECFNLGVPVCSIGSCFFVIHSSKDDPKQKQMATGKKKFSIDPEKVLTFHSLHKLV